MAAFPLPSKEAFHPFLLSLQDENRSSPKLWQSGTVACREGSGRKSRGENQGPAGDCAWRGCSESISAVMYTDCVCHSLTSRGKERTFLPQLCQGDIIGECFEKITAGKGKLQPEAQICESLSECSVGIACKEHMLESVKSYTNSPQFVRIIFCASRKKNTWFTKTSDQINF